jgi:archaellum component FlaC
MLTTLEIQRILDLAEQRFNSKLTSLEEAINELKQAVESSKPKTTKPTKDAA